MNPSGRSEAAGFRNAFLVFVVFLLAAAVYVDSFPGDFFTDDVSLVRENPLVAEPDLVEIFTSDYWGYGINSGLYRPLTIFSFAVGRKALGPGAWGVHLVNVLLHAAVTAALFLTLGAMGIPRSVSFLAAALFSVHPIHAEVVNMAVGRAELLAALFVLLALWSARSAHRGYEAATVLFFAAALLCKESAVTFPGLLLAADVFPSTRTRVPASRRWRLYALLAVVVAAWLVVRYRVALSTGVPPDVIYALDNPLVGLALLARIMTILKTQALYLSHLLVPLGLSPVYTGPYISPVETAASWWGMAGIAVAVTLGLAVITGWTKRQAYGLGVLLYLVSFSVTSNLFVLIAVLVADRFTYLPSAGFALAAASLGVAAVRRLGARRAAAVALGVVWVVALASLTLTRNREFRDPVTLWRSAAQRHPEDARAWYFLGVAQMGKGMAREAEGALRQAVAAEPAFPEPHVSLGDLLREEGRLEEAVDEYRTGIDEAPGPLLRAYWGHARASLLLGRPEEALALLEKAEPVYRVYGAFWEVKGKGLEAAGRLAEAAQAYEIAMGYEEVAADVPSRLGKILLGLGRYPEAEEAFHRDLQMNASPGALNNLGVALSLQGRHSEAVELFRRAVELNPASELYRVNYERSRMKMGSDTIF